MTLHPVAELTAYAVIIRAIHERGHYQDEALAELDRRGLWLTLDQKVQAGLASYWPRDKVPDSATRAAWYDSPSPWRLSA